MINHEYLTQCRHCGFLTAFPLYENGCCTECIAFCDNLQKMHSVYTPTQPELFARFKKLDLGVSWHVWLNQEKSADVRVFQSLGFGIAKLGVKSKRPVVGASWKTFISLDEAVAHTGNLALVPTDKWILLDRDGIETTPELEKLLLKTPSWATPNGYCLVVHEQFDQELNDELNRKLASKSEKEFFDKIRRNGEGYVCAPWSLTCPFDNADHNNCHYCDRCGCESIKEGKHHFRKTDSVGTKCSCNGQWNRHTCDYSGIPCPPLRFRLWINRKFTRIVSFKQACEILLGGS